MILHELRIGQTIRQCGMTIMPRRKALELLALCYAFGRGDSMWTMNARLIRAVLIAQATSGIEGGETPPADVVAELQQCIREIVPNGPLEKPAAPLPDWAVARLNEYGVKMPK